MATTTLATIPTSSPDIVVEVPALIRDFLLWIDREPRSYADALDAWRTSCPRLPVWEDAFEHGLVRLNGTSRVSMHDTTVEVTEAGRAYLNQ
jgi:hypothetical protein